MTVVNSSINLFNNDSQLHTHLNRKKLLPRKASSIHRTHCVSSSKNFFLKDESKASTRRIRVTRKKSCENATFSASCSNKSPFAKTPFEKTITTLTVLNYIMLFIQRLIALGAAAITLNLGIKYYLLDLKCWALSCAAFCFRFTFYYILNSCFCLARTEPTRQGFVAKVYEILYFIGEICSLLYEHSKSFRLFSLPSRFFHLFYTIFYQFFNVCLARVQFWSTYDNRKQFKAISLSNVFPSIPPESVLYRLFTFLLLCLSILYQLVFRRFFDKIYADGKKISLARLFSIHPSLYKFNTNYIRFLKCSWTFNGILYNSSKRPSTSSCFVCTHSKHEDILDQYLMDPYEPNDFLYINPPQRKTTDEIFGWDSNESDKSFS
ncbi:uncharacterized protein LOC128883453 [Hylaeus volcanicus]|uniref:uncharacterized protein LOC128883453 n=1 Tax=Hylaeus volcanicus TaxID=313075 RepID=UPI0023B7D92B|nr:uncharacterized protein LOC128883453 [Hylaeus volcanicus]XP_053991796.1 uncharacterized protein LOC128883453 [Hylaeus volcanicus]XP_053991797.1 uncharacterized protein LOC128883453 [Hylaeus volcanicus]